MKKTDSSSRFSLPVLAAVVGMIAFYLLTHLLRLNSFPVFADESIYIRWAQLLIDDGNQYAFFALNDGKTPLFVWMLAAAQSWSLDQLVAARLVSVLGGLVQMFAVGLILREFTQKKATPIVGMLLVAVLPFWFTYHRLAIMDGWLTAWLSLAFWAGLKVVRSGRYKWTWAVLSGAFFGLALWTKLPAVFFAPIFMLIPFFGERMTVSKPLGLGSLNSVKKLNVFVPFVVSALLGMAIFGLLIFSPAFGQLFSRGQDFSYPLSEVLAGKWMQAIPNLGRYLGFFGAYLTWPVLVLVVAGLFSTTERKSTGLFLLCTLIFLSPFIVLGKVVHPRYLLPAALFLTVAATLSLESLSERCAQAVKQGKVGWAIAGLFVALLAGQAFSQASYFDAAFIFTPDVTPFVKEDRQQYLEEWSSGHGILQTVQLIRQLSSSHSVAVATEGRFGTLPDGLLLYFHGQNVENIYIEGTGQYPVKTLPSFFTDRAKSFDQSLLVVNSHRLEMMLPKEKLVSEYCRPNAAPCLQVWDVTDLVKAVPDTRTP